MASSTITAKNTTVSIYAARCLSMLPGDEGDVVTVDDDGILPATSPRHT